MPELSWPLFGTEVRYLTIGDSVTSIPIGAFQDCGNLTSVTIGAGVTAIHFHVFRNTGLTSVTIPNNVTTIGWDVFQGSSNLRNLVVADGTSTLNLRNSTGSSSSGNGPFTELSIDTMHMGRNTSRQTDAGNNAPNLSWALFGTGVRYLTIGNSVTSVPNNAFRDCSELSSVTIGTGETIIENSAFQGVTSLKKIVIADGLNTLGLRGTGSNPGNGPFTVLQIDTVHMGRNTNRVNTIGEVNPILADWALFGIGVKHLTIGSSVTSIPSRAFMNCSDLISIFSHTPTPPTAQNNTFTNIHPNACLYVLPSSINTYTNAVGWSSISCVQLLSGFYTITFNSQDGNAVNPQTIEHGGKITEPTAPTRTGHTFGGWYKENTCVNAWDFATDVVTENITLYAKWAINYYTVTFNSQGGSHINPQTIEHGGKITEPTAPTRTTYTFGGWYKENICVNAWNFVTDVVTENITLYAKWTINYYTVTFNSQSGSAINPQTIEHGGKVTQPSNPALANHAFDGWYKEITCVNAWNFATDVVTESITLYAKWSVDLSIMEELIASLQAQILALQNDTMQLHFDTLRLYNQILGLMSDTTNLNSEILGLKNDIFECSETVLALRNDTVQLHADTLRLYEQVLALQNGTIALNTTITELMNDVSECGITVLALQSDTAKLHTDTLRLYNQVSALKSDTAYLRNLLALCEDDNKQIIYIEKLYDSVGKLYQLLTACGSQNNTLFATNQALHDSIGGLHQLFTACGNQNNTLLATNQALHDSIGGLHQQLASCDNQNNTLLATNQALNDTINKLNLFIIELVEINEDLWDTIVWLRQLLAECNNNATNIVETGRAPSLRMYPNPVTNELHIVIPPDLPANTVVELFDMNGRRVFSQRIPAETGRAPSLHGTIFTIDMSPFHPGNYILRIGNRAAKIVKQ